LAKLANSAVSEDKLAFRLITGRVNSTGTIATGSGFSVSRLGEGKYRITFSTAFSSTPVVVATASDYNIDDEDNFATVCQLRTTSFIVRTWDGTDTGTEDSEFNFIVIGPR